MKKRFTEEQIKAICEGLANGDTAREIANTIGVEHTNYFATYMSRIRNKEIWNDITKEYNFKLTKREKNIREICKYIAKGYTTKEICEKFKKDDKKYYFVRLVRRIRSGECYRYISIEYGIVDTIEKDPERIPKKRQRVHNICKCLERGMKPKEIAIELNEEYDKNFANLVTNIKNRKVYKDISSIYSFRRNYTVDEIHQICEGIDRGLTYREIAKSLKIAYTKKVGSYFSKIKGGFARQDIAKDYNFYKERIRA